MSRVKRGVAAHKKHKKLLSQAEGRRASKHKLVRPAREAAMHALRYAYRDRRARKGQFRALWITRINAAARDAGSLERREPGWYRGGPPSSRRTAGFVLSAQGGDRGDREGRSRDRRSGRARDSGHPRSSRPGREARSFPWSRAGTADEGPEGNRRPAG